MIQHGYDGQVFKPRFICDACLLPIDDYGNVYWLVKEDREVMPGTWFTHKYECALYDKELEDRYPGCIALYEELDRFAIQLAYGVTKDGNRKALARLAKTGKLT